VFLLADVFVQELAPGTWSNRPSEHPVLDPVLLRLVVKFCDRPCDLARTDRKEVLQREAVSIYPLAESVNFCPENGEKRPKSCQIAKNLD